MRDKMLVAGLALVLAAVAIACDEGEGDGADAGAEPGDWVDPCDGECTAGEYTDCTCRAADPCNWAPDGICDDECYDVNPNGLDDSVDCKRPLGGGGPCGPSEPPHDPGPM